MTFWDVVAKDPSDFLFFALIAVVVCAIALVRIAAHVCNRGE